LFLRPFPVKRLGVEPSSCCSVAAWDRSALCRRSAPKKPDLAVLHRRFHALKLGDVGQGIAGNSNNRAPRTDGEESYEPIVPMKTENRSATEMVATTGTHWRKG